MSDAQDRNSADPRSMMPAIAWDGTAGELIDYLCWCRCGHSDKEHRWEKPRPVPEGGTLAQLQGCQTCREEHPLAWWRRCIEFRDSGRGMTALYVNSGS